MQNLSVLHLPGPEFLNVYGAVAIIVLAAAWLLIRFADDTDKRPPPPVPQSPDAMEVAFLQGGVNQVVRTICYDLVQRGYAALAKEDRIVPTGKTPGALPPLERRVLGMIQARPKAHELFKNRAARKELIELLEPVRARLAAQDLVKPDSVKVWRSRVQIGGALVLVGFAGAKIYIALTTGHTNVSYLLFLCIASVMALFVLAYVATRSHASRRGRAYLQAMELAYRPRLDAALLNTGAPSAAKAFEGASLFLIGLYGFSALKGTADAAFLQHFKRASGESGSSCGSSCGGACGSSDGGGGCGGCGGGD
ncbi:MAG TPA: TIGR04222 domain-containing membrane protein [Methylocystis sp.]|jgi:uncharacterized protein (TIGR04222 family)